MVTTESLCYSQTAREKNWDNTPKDLNAFMNLLQLAEVLRSIERLLGVDLIVNSGFRTPALNEAVDGSPSSWHLLGLAADITIEDCPRCSLTDLKNLCKELRKTRFSEVIVHETFVHVAIKKYYYS